MLKDKKKKKRGKKKIKQKGTRGWGKRERPLCWVSLAIAPGDKCQRQINSITRPKIKVNGSMKLNTTVIKIMMKQGTPEKKNKCDK